MDAEIDHADTLAKALRFYANPSDYKSPMTGGFGKLYYDCGLTAKQALADYEAIALENERTIK